MLIALQIEPYLDANLSNGLAKVITSFSTSRFRNTNGHTKEHDFDALVGEILKEHEGTFTTQIMLFLGATAIVKEEPQRVLTGADVDKMFKLIDLKTKYLSKIEVLILQVPPDYQMQVLLNLILKWFEAKEQYYGALQDNTLNICDEDAWAGARVDPKIVLSWMD